MCLFFSRFYTNNSSDIDGVKAFIEEKIKDHFEEHPELELNDNYKKYFQHRKRAAQKPASRRTSGFATIKLEGEEEDLDESGDSEDQDDEVEEEVLEEVDDDAVKDSQDNSFTTKESLEDAKDKLYEVYKTSFVEHYENAKEKTIDYYEEAVDYLTDGNVTLKNILSEPYTLFNGELILEFFFILNKNIKVVNLAHYTPASIKAHVPAVVKSLPIYKLEDILKPEFLKLATFWFAISALLPLIASYYVNFNKSGLKYDPFSFFVTRGLLNFIFLGDTYTFEDVKNDADVSAAKLGLTEVTSWQIFKDFTFRNSIILRNTLGLIPLFGVLIGLLVSFYVK